MRFLDATWLFSGADDGQDACGPRRGILVWRVIAFNILRPSLPRAGRGSGDGVQAAVGRAGDFRGVAAQLSVAWAERALECIRLSDHVKFPVDRSFAPSGFPGMDPGFRTVVLESSISFPRALKLSVRLTACLREIKSFFAPLRVFADKV